MTSAHPGSESGSPESDSEPTEEVKVTDKRRTDPESGQARPTVAEPEPNMTSNEAEPDADSLELDIRVAEVTADLQRVTAEYANYRKRAERDREAVAELAVVSVLSELLPVLDDIELARQNNDLNGTFKTVAESLEASTTKMGMERFGSAGDEFDPAIHEALSHAERDAETVEEGTPDGPVCAQIYQPGYRFKERIVRPARVAVVE